MRNIAAAFLVTVATSLSLGCIPWAQNLTGTPKLPNAVVQYFDPSKKVLVLPVWYDNGPCNIRGPVVLLGGSLSDLEEYLEPRWRLGVMGIDGHGPSHYRSISGFLLVSADGTMVWTSHLSPITKGVLSIQLRSDLSSALSASGTVRPGDFGGSSTEPFFGWACAQGAIGIKVNAEQRELAAGFLQQAITRDGP